MSVLLSILLLLNSVVVVSSSIANEFSNALREELLAKATILSNKLEPKQQHKHHYRSLEEAEEEEEEESEDNENGDDYYVSNQIDFDGFSLKYAKCQTVQRFSEDAIKNGEYSAMVKDDIVVLRLCPTNQCNSNKNYGCHYNYIEYGIDITEYVRVMLKYTIDKREKMCNFCNECGYRRDRKLEEEVAEENAEEEAENVEEEEQNEMQQEEENDEVEEENEEVEEQQQNNMQQDEGDDAENFDDDDYYKGDDGYDDGYTAAQYDDDGNVCTDYYDTCQDISSWCQGAADDDVGYLDYADYLDYLDCVQIEGVDNYGDAAYWIRPHCDSDQQGIHMDIFYDPYCSQYAGNDVNLREFSGIYFKQSLFSDFTDGNCIDCSETNYGPFYDSNHYMCNRIHSGSAVCSQNLMTELYEDSDDSSVPCSFIESLQSGTYNSNGEIYFDTSLYGEKVKEEASAPQMAGLVISVVLCVGLGLYSCYLHHSITNLLIKSLSHSHLLPPSRHRNRSKSRGRSSSGSRKGTSDKDEEDWDHSVGNQK
mmetsp:Transcript_37880/g.43262  ORF Transcript_37880/g.43262 Transcript_37880/m.43262 type:complete len:536 (-) Transcript_37880:205-1812(-)